MYSRTKMPMMTDRDNLIKMSKSKMEKFDNVKPSPKCPIENKK
jgi:hypothetical protein